MPTSELSIYFFAQMAVILVACRVVGYAGQRWLGQPQVVGEMIAGVILGPSLFGMLAPELQASLFPEETRKTLYVVAQLGVGLYMFLVGLEFRSDLFRQNVKSAVSVSVAGMAAPFVVAIIVTPMLLGIPGLFAPDVNQAEATLFMGAAIAITAFPMLARIIHERGLSGSALGTLSLSAGAIDDAAAWIVLAIVLASFGGGAIVAIKAIGGALIFVVIMLTIGQRALRRLAIWADQEGNISQTLLALTLILFMSAAFFMDYVGIHAVFGGFVLGAMMPRGFFANEVRKQLEPVTVVLLLPAFFTYSGLNTQLSLIADPALAGMTMLILGASILAKGGACWAAARLTGHDNRTAMGVGALMNARGLMELIIINIGLQKGIIGPGLFSILVVMAIVTTLMASPLFRLSQRFGKESEAPRSIAGQGKD